MKRHVLSVAIIVTALMIFLFSAQSGEASGTLSGRIAAWIVGLFVADPPMALLEWVGFLIRKLAHFSEYALLGGLICAYREARPYRRRGAWGFTTLYAISDEIHQMFVDGRGPAVADVLIDSAGAAAGVMAVWLASRHWSKR